MYSSLLFAASTAGAEIVDKVTAVGNSEVPVMHWIVFCVMVTILILLDMLVFHRKDHTPSLKESAAWTVFWSALALGFCIWLDYWAGKEAAVSFLTGYVVEWSLSMDNVFIFVVLFSFFGVQPKYQYRVLFWGIFGAIVMRLTFILAAGKLFTSYETPMFTFFGLFLLFTGVKLSIKDDNDPHPDNNWVVRIARRFLPIAKGDHGNHFFVRVDGKLYATTLFLVLLVVESTDVLFALDSVPAIFGIIKKGPLQTYLVFTSNVFAIMGLRALYFLLAGIMDMFRYLNYGLSAILCFIGLKMLVKVWSPHEWETVHKFESSPIASLCVIAFLLGSSILASIVAAKKEEREGKSK